MKRVKIANRWVGEGAPVFFVAEAGINHNGDLGLAKRLVDIAISSGADAVKFQKRNVREVFVRDVLDEIVTKYNRVETYEQYKTRGELSEDDFRELARYCRERGIIFFASPWDRTSVDFLETLDVPAHKIASADLTNTPLVEYVAKTGKPIIMSVGMSTLEEVDEAVRVIRQYHDQLILLHCVSTYPAKMEELNLLVMNTLRERYNCPIGYSGHENGIAMGLVAAAMGAVVVEKHFTLDRTLIGPDHAASLEPEGLFRIIRDIRNLEKAKGSPEKRILETEQPIRRKLAKSIVARRYIHAGEVISEDMLTTKSPAVGLSPQLWYRVVGTVAVKDFPPDAYITMDKKDEKTG